MKTSISIIYDNPVLKAGLKWINENSTSNMLPYHNLNHLLTVVFYCDTMSNHYKVTGTDKDNILLAALFHDVNHTGGKESDVVNVENSKNAIQQFMSTISMDPEYTYGEGISYPFDIELICSLLDATQYPYVIAEDKLTLLQQIIRDADLMQIFEYNWIHQNIYGIAKELNKSVVEFLPLQRKFMESATFNTEYGKKMREYGMDARIEELDMLINSLQ